MAYEGHCLCGGCKVVVNAEPHLNGVAVCHCTDCKTCSGTAFASVVFVPKDSTTVDGTVKLYSYKNTRSGSTISRWFCEVCGSQIMSQSDAHPERFAVRASTIKEFGQLPVVIEVFVKDRWPSIPAIPGAKQVEAMP